MGYYFESDEITLRHYKDGPACLLTYFAATFPQAISGPESPEGCVL
jgi:hypothetical protein